MSLRSWGAAWAGAGTAAAATAAGACCVPVLAPLLVSVLGVGGAIWAARLEPYAPYLLGVSGLAVGYGFWTVYRRRPKAPCEADLEGAAPSAECPPRRPIALQVFLWLAGAVWIFALGLHGLRWIAT